MKNTQNINTEKTPLLGIISAATACALAITGYGYATRNVAPNVGNGFTRTAYVIGDTMLGLKAINNSGVHYSDFSQVARSMKDGVFSLSGPERNGRSLPLAKLDR